MYYSKSVNVQIFYFDRHIGKQNYVNLYHTHLHAVGSTCGQIHDNLLQGPYL